MGVATSTTKKVREEQQMLHPHEHLDKDDEVVVRLMLPIYYTTAEVTTVEYEIVSNCWTLILTNAAPGFLSLRKDPNFKFPTSISFFYKIFYSRLFDIHPGCRDLFKDVNTQGKFLVKMITLSLSEKKDPEKYEDTLRKLAQVHNERGVKAVEYGLVGDVLFWSLERCVGPDIYNQEMHEAWIKIYSRMLRTMVPLAVAYELKDGSTQQRRLFQTCTLPSAHGCISMEDYSVETYPSLDIHNISTQQTQSATLY